MRTNLLGYSASWDDWMGCIVGRLLPRMLLLANEWDGSPGMQFCTRFVGSSPEWVRPILPAAAGTVAVAGMIPGIDRLLLAALSRRRSRMFKHGNLASMLFPSCCCFNSLYLRKLSHGRVC